MRTLLIAVTLAVLTLSGAAVRAEPPRPLKLASWDWPPFSGPPDQSRVAIEIVHEALKRAGYAASSTPLSNAAIETALKGGTFDGTECAWESKEREAYLLYSRPYLENRLILLARKGTDVSATRFEQLKGKKVALVERYAYGDAVEKPGGPTFVRGASLQANFKALLEGKVDYLLEDELVVEYLFERDPDKAKATLVAGEYPLLKRGLHLAVRKSAPDAAGIVKHFNEQIRQMLADGTYNQLLGLQWVHADADGDGKSELILGGTQAGPAPPNHSYAVAADKAEKLHKLPSAFWIEGARYESWGKVPDRYKQVPVGSGVTPVYRGIPVLEF